MLMKTPPERAVEGNKNPLRIVTVRCEFVDQLFDAPAQRQAPMVSPGDHPGRLGQASRRRPELKDRTESR